MPSIIKSDIITVQDHLLHRLSAVPEGRVNARAFILHGYGDHSGKYLHFMDWLADHRIEARAADFRGHGRSTGRVAHVVRWDEYLDDLAAMLSPVVGPTSPDAPPAVPWFIIAHSHGALIAIIAANRGLLPGCAGIILSAPYLALKIRVPVAKRIFAVIASRLLPGIAIKSGVVGPLLTRDKTLIAENKTDPYCPGVATPRWFTTATQKQAEARAGACQFTLPLLMLVAGDDRIADSRAAITFFEQAGSSDKQIRHYPQSRHELLRDLDREQVFKDMLDWIEKRSVYPLTQTTNPASNA